MSKKIKLFVLTSVILNVIFIGLFAGHIYHKYTFKHGNNIVSIIKNSSMPQTKKEELLKQVKLALPNKENFKKNHKWHAETIKILTAETFDATAYKEHLNKMVEFRNNEKQQMLDSIIAVASELNQQERVELAKMFKRMNRKGPR